MIVSLHASESAVCGQMSSSVYVPNFLFSPEGSLLCRMQGDPGPTWRLQAGEERGYTSQGSSQVNVVNNYRDERQANRIRRFNVCYFF